MLTYYTNFQFFLICSFVSIFGVCILNYYYIYCSVFYQNLFSSLYKSECVDVDHSFAIKQVYKWSKWVDHVPLEYRASNKVNCNKQSSITFLMQLCRGFVCLSRNCLESEDVINCYYDKYMYNIHTYIYSQFTKYTKYVYARINGYMPTSFLLCMSLFLKEDKTSGRAATE